MRPFWIILLLLALFWMPKEQCYGCKNTYADLSNHLHKCQKALAFVDGGLRRRVDQKQEKSRLREAAKQRKAEEKRAKAAEVKERLAAHRAQLEVEREASMPVTFEDTPSGRCHRQIPAKFADMLPTSLKGLPHLRLKPGMAAPAHRHQVPATPVPPSTSAVNIPPSWPHATVQDTPDDPMDDVQPAFALRTCAQTHFLC
ncbi:hypothetical protein LXA43DRAFT_1063026 [Ganoderma leucocontextum]|nr:hypothetical protein LXA43DRAFT_1063026 [Ganoderma leucocontextum]